MSNTIHQRATSIKEGAKEKTKLSGWFIPVIPKQPTTFGDADTW
jgi:hypothetical protein